MSRQFRWPLEDQYYDDLDSRRTSSFSSEDCDHTPPSATQQQENPRPNSMSSWFQRTTSSSQAQFAATALVSGAVVAGAIFGYQHLRRQERVEDLKSSIPELGRGHSADKVGFHLIQRYASKRFDCKPKIVVGEILLTEEVKLTDFGAASPTIPLSKEDERSAALAARAQKGDYDDGMCGPHMMPAMLTVFRSHSRTTCAKPSLSHK